MKSFRTAVLNSIPAEYKHLADEAESLTGGYKFSAHYDDDEELDSPSEANVKPQASIQPRKTPKPKNKQEGLSTVELGTMLAARSGSSNATQWHNALNEMNGTTMTKFIGIRQGQGDSDLLSAKDLAIMLDARKGFRAR